MFGCCPYLSRISISSEGSLLLLSMIWNTRSRGREARDGVGWLGPFCPLPSPQLPLPQDK